MSIVGLVSAAGVLVHPEAAKNFWPAPAPRARNVGGSG
jgi:hypothetical protein